MYPVHLPVPHNEGLLLPVCKLKAMGSDSMSSKLKSAEHVKEHYPQSHDTSP